MRTLNERFTEKVRKTRGCWFWIGSKNTHGYGQMSLRGEVRGAHRISYEIYVGPIPAGMCVCHSCDRPECVKPGHLFLGTHSDNIQDMLRKGRHKTGLGVYDFHKAKEVSEGKMTDRERHDAKLTLRGLGVSQEELSQIAGVHRVTVSRYFRGALLEDGLAIGRIEMALRELRETPRETLLDDRKRAGKLIAISKRVAKGT